MPTVPETAIITVVAVSASSAAEGQRIILSYEVR